MLRAKPLNDLPIGTGRAVGTGTGTNPHTYATAAAGTNADSRAAVLAGRIGTPAILGRTTGPRPRLRCALPHDHNDTGPSAQPGPSARLRHVFADVHPLRQSIRVAGARRIRCDVGCHARIGRKTQQVVQEIWVGRHEQWTWSTPAQWLRRSRRTSRRVRRLPARRETCRGPTDRP